MDTFIIVLANVALWLWISKQGYDHGYKQGQKDFKEVSK